MVRRIFCFSFDTAQKHDLLVHLHPNIHQATYRLDDVVHEVFLKFMQYLVLYKCLMTSSPRFLPTAFHFSLIFKHLKCHLLPVNKGKEKGCSESYVKSKKSLLPSGIRPLFLEMHRGPDKPGWTSS